MILQCLDSLYKYCCFRCPENKTKSDDELRDVDVKIILESFKKKMDRMNQSRIKCC